MLLCSCHDLVRNDSCRNIAVAGLDIVKQYYPEANILEYEVGKRSYEVKLSNRMEMKFNTKFQVIGLDD